MHAFLDNCRTVGQDGDNFYLSFIRVMSTGRHKCLQYATWYRFHSPHLVFREVEYPALVTLRFRQM